MSCLTVLPVPCATLHPKTIGGQIEKEREDVANVKNRFRLDSG